MAAERALPASPLSRLRLVLTCATVVPLLPLCWPSTTSTGCCRPLGLMRLLWGMSATSRDVSLKARCRAPGRSHSTNQVRVPSLAGVPWRQMQP